ncbi:transcriptional regulator [Thalassolituus oleivorans]|uniref:XRE family transcriptional regulator n=1 Tax=Thalassolituus oleivorans TaxID=187493 RepID=UPI00094927B3|nr:XRE family transcriptional regulator [Thalassolituus oleivorans]APR66404.1 transcriptional regulator [Thalassolituus oleivorans]
MIGERLKRARAASGLSMADLGSKAGVSATMIQKYERGNSMPSSSVLIAISKALGVRTEYFFRPNVVQLSGVEYRKKASTPKKILNKLTADVLDQAERWFELRNLWPEFPMPEFDAPDNLPEIRTLEEIEDVALAVRQSWRLGIDAIGDLIGLLESHGILVITTDLEHADKIDGLQASVEGIPVVVVSTAWPGCRQRFTLAHELGHLILHDLLPSDMDEEKACNRFAGAFLFPRDSVLVSLGNERHGLNWKELDLLKHEFGVSMSAIMYRGKDLGILSDRVHQRLSIEFSKNGWRSNEPGEPYPREHTLLFEQLVYRGAGEGILSDSKAAELLKMSSYDFRKSKMMAS